MFINPEWSRRAFFAIYQWENNKNGVFRMSHPVPQAGHPSMSMEGNAAARWFADVSLLSNSYASAKSSPLGEGWVRLFQSFFLIFAHA